ncbi:MAG: hypothetical protein IKD74_04945 [Clostridia bacterium]|nr:hypothetical protein [Clostridia bacterium]
MTEQDIKNKNKVLIDYLRSIINDFVIRAEYSTYDEDKNVIVVQEESGSKVVFFEANPIYNYYNVDIFGTNIQVSKEVSVDIGNLIGQNIYFEWINEDKETQNWQILIKQFSNPRTLQWSDIRRVSYTMTLQVIINRIS